MTQNDLREKVINAEAKVAKRKAVLKKHREQLAKLIQKGADEFDISIKKDDIESAKRKLEEAEKILNNWKEKLDERITADDYLEANAPEILNEWETDDINDALEALRLDPRAVALNGYYLGHFGDMTIEDIAAGIRYHYERGTNVLADDDILTQARADIEAARKQAAEAGLPFSERLVDGPEDELNPYIYDGSMTAEDYNAMQAAREAHAALTEVVTSHYPDATEEAVERVAEAASSMKLSPEAVQRILDAFDNIIEAINRMIEWAAQAIRTLADFFGETLDNFILRRAPPKWRHYALHAKRARVRKKYRNRIRRAFFAALASEGGGSS